GADLSGGGETFDSGAQGAKPSGNTGVPRDGGGLLTLRIFECLKPVIAAINGPAVGVGVTMTLPMDIRMASEDAKIGFVFAKRGLVPEAASSWFLPRIVGISQSMEWVATGRVFPASEGLEGGLLRSVHTKDELLPAAYALAKEIAESTAPVSVSLSRHMLWRMLGADHPMEAHKIDSRAIHTRGSSEDVREGVMSFLEKRPASYPMRVSSGMPDWFPWWDEREFS
ncbi:MAG TPA: enoyl-CoA hydratase-related protein, partial [Acidimicrobiales bacterium]|nr:enoyl-CoA hydratase-related protein [Acidimicrobiales bacterium]